MKTAISIATAGLFLVVLSFGTAGAAPPEDCIPGTNNGAFCVVRDGGIGVYPSNIQIIPGIFIASFNITNGDAVTNTINTQLGCVVDGEYHWFEDSFQPAITSRDSVTLGPFQTGVTAALIERRTLYNTGCEGEGVKASRDAVGY